MIALIGKLRNLLRRRSGSAAIEFAIMILPFTVLIFVIMEISLLYFVDTALDSATHKAARKIRVGYAQENNWTIKDFKQDICSNMLLSFGCSDRLIVKVSVIDDISSVNYAAATANGILSVGDSYDSGKAGDFVLVQAFLPWNPIFKLYSFSTSTLKDGTYILAVAELFKNEPF